MRAIFLSLSGFSLLAFLLWLAAAAIAQTTSHSPAAASAHSAKITAAESSAASRRAVRLNNLGVAYMNQQKLARGLQLFEQAEQADPRLLAARLNRGIALLNLQRFAPAEKILLNMTRQDPTNIRAWYNLGLLYRAQGEVNSAITAFERAAELDPADAETQYFLGYLYDQSQQYGQAVAAYDKALTLNPFEASAEFGLARSLQRMGKTEEARQHLARFQHLTQEKLAAPISLVYGEQGKYALAEQVATPETVPPAIPVHFELATEKAGLAAESQSRATPENNTLASALGPGACFIDFDNDGRIDLFLVNQGPNHHAALYHNVGHGRFENVTAASGLDIADIGFGCSAGDYDNDGLPDLAVAYEHGVRIFHNEGKGRFRDATAKLGIRSGGIPIGVSFVDYDHDGDLDLFITRLADGPANFPEEDFSAPAGASASNVLWRNNGNGTFTEMAQAAGMAGSSPSIAALASDLNNDRAIDFVVTGWRKSPELFLNPREGNFAAVDLWKGTVPSPTAGAAALDFNKDGWMDLALTHFAPPGLTLWRNREGKSFERVALPNLDWKRAFGVAVLDYDNDGWLDIAAVGESERGDEIRLFRNEGPSGFKDVTHAVGLDKIVLRHPRALIAGDYDGDGATDLLITQNGGDPVLLRNLGGNRNSWIQIKLAGLHDNRSAVGTKVEVFAGGSQQKFEVPSSSGYLGQSAPFIVAGLGKARQADVVRLLWPTGVLQDEVELAARTAHDITEIDRRGSSCPTLFVWDGKEFEFVSDVIGAAVIGHWVGPGERNIADSKEYVKVEGNRVKLRNGRLSLRFGEPMEEVNYLDQVRLLAVDHPQDAEIYPNERFLSNPPFPEFKIISSRGARPPVAAFDDQGRDVLPELRQRDRKYVSGFERLSFSGFAQPHTLTLDLGSLDPARPLRLLMHGFTEYFSANSMFAAHQAGIDVVAPYLEALDSSGRWVRILDDMGFPAGLPRTIVVDLSGRLPKNSQRIRIVTNLQIYWDQILVDTTPPGIPVLATEVPLAAAQLRFHGYPRQVQDGPLTDLTYHYNQTSLTGPFTNPVGQYTRYGDVRRLLEKSDDQFVIFGSGEEVDLEFDPQKLPALPAGWTRDYLFFADGFVKDMDFYESDALTVDPLPFHAMGGYPYPASRHYPWQSGGFLDYLLNYNTRYVSGRPQGHYRFDFGRQPAH